MLAFLLTGTTNAAKPRLRKPVDIAVSADGRHVFTANRCGSISVVDAAKRATVNEIDVGESLSALAVLGEKHLLVTDERRHQLVLLSGTGTAWKPAARLKVAAYPVDLVVSRDGQRCYVSSLWSRSVTTVDLSAANSGKLRAVKVIRLPFVPRTLCLCRDDMRLIVAASFDGTLAVVDTRRHSVAAIQQIPGHNIRGLAVSVDGSRLLTAQQVLNSHARSTFDDVHWGNMMTNVMYSFALDDLCNPKADPLKNRRTIHLGAPENAAGDPGAIAVARGRIAIALAGVHQIAVSRGLNDALNRVSVGRGPVALALSQDGRRVFTADRFSDTVSIVDAVSSKRVAQVSLGPRPKLRPADVGEQLFFDAKLSHDGWMSCHGCHTNGHTNGRLNDNLSDGGFGAPKRVLSLLGVAGTAPFAWNGKFKRLEQQVRNSVTKTMRGESVSEEQAAAIAAYLKTLKPPPPPGRFDERPNTAAIQSGRKLFAKFNCRRCHSPPTYTSPGTYDVGLKDSAGNKRFNPPSLRGVGWRRQLFHDGRAQSLREVFAKYRHQLPRVLSKDEVAALIAYLRSL